MTRSLLLSAALAALVPGRAAAQDVVLELTEDGLNRIVRQLGDPGDGGVHQPNLLATLGYKGCRAVGVQDCAGPTGAVDAPQGTRPRAQVLLSRCQGPDGRDAVVPGAEPVSWQWWITQARFSIAAQQLSFAASVRYRVGRQWSRDDRTVPAALTFDAAGQRLSMTVSAFTVPIAYSADGVVEAVTEVDVGRHMSFAIPIGAQTLQVRSLDGSPRTLTSRAQSATVEYLAGRVLVRVDAAFN